MIARSRRSLSTFRFHLALTTAIVSAAFALAIAAALFAPLGAQFEDSALDSAELAGLARYLLHLHESYWPVVAVMLAASIASGFLLFQHMRSPLARFTRAFESVERGEKPEPIQIRSLDYLQDEAEALNHMLAALANRAELATRELVRLDESLEEIVSCDLEPKAIAALAEAREAAMALRARLSAAA